MITKAVIAMILFGLTSSANAMTVIFKDYKAANNDEKAFYLLYLDGVREGIIELNVVLEEKRQQPLFCLPEKLELTIEQAEYIMMRQAEKITDPDQLPIGLLLAQYKADIAETCIAPAAFRDRAGGGKNHAPAR